MKAKHLKAANKWLLQAVLDPAWNPEPQEMMTAVTHAAVDNPATLLKIVVWATNPRNVVQEDNAMCLAATYAMMFPNNIEYNIGAFEDNHCILGLVGMQTYSPGAKRALKKITDSVTTIAQHTLPKGDGLSPGALLKRIVSAPELKHVKLA